MGQAVIFAAGRVEICAISKMTGTKQNVRPEWAPATSAAGAIMQFSIPAPTAIAILSRMCHTIPFNTMPYHVPHSGIVVEHKP